MSAFHACIHMFHVHARCLQRDLEEGIRCPRTGITDGYDTPHRCYKPNLGHLKNNRALNYWTTSPASLFPFWQETMPILDTVAHAFNPSTLEVEAGGTLWVQGQTGLHSDSWTSQSSTVRLCLIEGREEGRKRDCGHSKSLQDTGLVSQVV